MAVAYSLLVLLSLGAAAEPEDEPADIPIVGRPANLPFSWASGTGFKAVLKASPTTLTVDDTVTLTWQIRAEGKVVHPPRRVDLRKVSAFSERFHVDAEHAGDKVHPTAATWEFIYRVKPRQAGVVEVPDLPFVFFDPSHPYARRAFQVLHTEPIRLTVAPPPAYPLALEAPERFFTLATGPGLLTSQKPWEVPHSGFILAFLLSAPLGTAAWYFTWRRLNPDAARTAGLRRSRAARHALHALHRAAHLPPREQAARAATAVAGYLRHRFDLAVAEPTPAEAGQHLRHAGCATEAEDIRRFLAACDAARYQANGHDDACDLATTAEKIILAVEAESCRQSSS